jgi:ppGpp synthetase/RelA/SpoT-type nucleotidyltranferase
VLKEIKNIDKTYIIKYKYPLIRDQEPKLYVKSWEYFLNKTFRKNVLNNNKFPEEPEYGWCLPPDWYVQIHDIVRTTIIVKYIDGVPMLLERLRKLASVDYVESHGELISREDGYYGAHFGCCFDCVVSTIEWREKTNQPIFEIQIST